jgi:tRNA pseudouridine38-40 synthase
VTLFDENAAPAAPPREGRPVRVRLVVAYDGAPFHGFAVNPGVATVAGALADAIARVLRAPVELTGAGRTDAGVHAWGQVVTFDAPAAGLDLVRLQRSLNGLCAPAIVVREAAVVSPDFDARFSAAWRHYRYQVLNTAVPDPFRAATTWHVARPLDLRLMQLACDPLIGEHDFASFCRPPKVGPDVTPPSLRRKVLIARWSEVDDGLLRFEIRANAFCHQMVRSIVGTLVDVGLGRRRAGEMTSILRAGDRSAAGAVAPPHGLCLWEVGYP